MNQSENRCPACHRYWKTRIDEFGNRLYTCDCGGSYRTKYFKDGIAFCSNPYFVFHMESTYGTVPSKPLYIMADKIL